MTHAHLPPVPPPPDAPASESSIQELIALERDRAGRDAKRSTTRRAIAFVVVTLILCIGAAVAGILIDRAEKRDQCVSGYVWEGYSQLAAELACK